MGRTLVVQHYCYDRHIVFHNSFPSSCQIRLFIRIDSSMITSTITIDVSVWRKGDRLSQETFTFVYITPDATHTVRTNLDTCLSFVIGTPYSTVQASSVWRPSVCPFHRSTAATAAGGFAAERLAGRKNRLIATRSSELRATRCRRRRGAQ